MGFDPELDEAAAREAAEYYQLSLGHSRFWEGHVVGAAKHEALRRRCPGVRLPCRLTATKAEPRTRFYEWLSKGKEKLPHFTKLPDGQLMVLAGLYDAVT